MSEVEEGAGATPASVGAGAAQVVGVGAAPVFVAVVCSATLVMLWPEAIKNQAKSLFMCLFISSRPSGLLIGVTRGSIKARDVPCSFSLPSSDRHKLLCP